MSILLLMDDDGLLSPPSGFGYTPPFNIYSDGTTSFRFDSLYDAIDPADITDYYVSPSGAPGNDGLTPALPKRSLGGIIAAAAGAATPWVRINMDAGDYPHNEQISLRNGDMKNVIMRAAGNVRTGPFLKGTFFTWANTSGTTYSTTRAGVNAVLNDASFDSFGDYAKFTLAASQVACEATPNSWFLSGSTLYVNNGVGQPGVNILICLSANNAQIINSNTQWIFDAGASNKIEFIGGNNYCLDSLPNGVGHRLYFRNCWFRFSPANGLNVRGTPLSIMYGGGASANGTDGLNYHADNSLTYFPVAIEIGCNSFNNGVSGTTQNCSTMHDGGTIIRVNGSYNGSLGPVVADVNDGTQSWNIRCDARNSTINDSSATDASWCVFTGTAKMWLDRCTYGAGASTSEYDLSVGAGSTMYLRGTLPGTNSVAGTLTTY